MSGIYFRTLSFIIITLMLISVSWAQDRRDNRGNLVVTADGRVVQENAHIDTAELSLLTPNTPVARLTALGSNALNPVAQFKSTAGSMGGLKNPGGSSESPQCVVDFSDFDALNLLTFAPEGFSIYAEDTFTWSPWWFQACNALDHVVVRPTVHTHFHLGYEDPHIMPCPGSFSDWGIMQEDGTCQQFDPREKPRNLHPHDESETIQLYVWDGNQKRIFSLKSIRVLGQNPIRLCYKPDQQDDGAWETSEPDGSTTPGIWFCWDELHTGNWDLSAYATFITDVKFSAVEGQDNISVDDIILQIN